MAKLVYVHPVNFFPEQGQVEILNPINEEEVARVIGLAEGVGYMCESAVVDRPEFTHRIRLNDPAGEGYHRDYFARIE